MAVRSKKLLKVIDGIRSWNISTSQSPTSAKPFVEIEEVLKSEQFQVGKIAVHGFPCQPTCIAFDPVQRIVAIGTRSGVIRIFGRPGVDYVVFHPSSSAVIQIIFLVNEGGLISICHDDVLHLWNIRQKNPELVHSLQFKRERLTCGHVPVGSGWLYLGTDKGNVHFVNVQRFTTSGYVINWNKAIDITQSAHPGRVVQIAENPQDTNKLLIGYSSGFLVLWDLRTKTAEARFQYSDNLNGFCWHWEGKNFVTCHKFGILATWAYRQPQRPISVTCPHAGGEGVPDDYTSYEPIQRVDWLPTKTGEPLIVFAGGCRLLTTSSTSAAATLSDSNASTTASKPKSASPLPSPTDASSTSSPEAAGSAERGHAESVVTSSSSSSKFACPSLTVKRGKRLVVMQMDYRVVQFVTLNASPYVSDSMDPYAVAVLLQNDLVVVDLLSPSFATFENPYPMDLHTSPVTSCVYLVDCPPDLVPLFYSVGSRGNRNQRVNEPDAFSSRDWPINGGEWGVSYNPYPELVLTGHADGSVRFWDASEVTLTPLYKVRTLKYFANTTSSGAIKPPTVSGEETSRGPTNSDEVNANYSPVLLSTEPDPFAIRAIHFCPESRWLLTASSTHVCLMHFSRREQTYETPVLDINMAFDGLDDIGINAGDAFADDQLGPGGCGTITKEKIAHINIATSRNASNHPGGSVSSAHSVSCSDKDLRVFVPIRFGSLTWPPGFQPVLICRIGVPGIGFDSIPGSGLPSDPTLLPPPSITTARLNSHYGLLAIGNEFGVAVVDYINRICLLSTSSADLNNPLDLYVRGPNRSPGRFPTNTSGQNSSCEQKTYEQHSSVPRVLPKSLSSECTSSYEDSSDASRSKKVSVVPAHSVVALPSEDTKRNFVTRPSVVVIDGDTCEEFEAFPEVTWERCSDVRKADSQHSEGRLLPATADYSDEFALDSSEPSSDAPSSESFTLVPDENELTQREWSFTLLDLRRDSQSKKSPSSWFKQKSENNAKRPVVIKTIDVLKLVSPLAAALVLTCRASSIHRQLCNASHQQQKRYSDLVAQSRSGSLSTSTSSLDQMSSESVKTVVFMDSYARKQDLTPMRTMWIGTGRGTVLALHLPGSIDTRGNQTVTPIIPTGSIYRLHGEILHIGFLDLTGDLLSSPSERWEEMNLGHRCPPPLVKQMSNASSTISSGLDSASTAGTGTRQGDPAAIARRLGTGGPVSRTPKEFLVKQSGSTTRNSSSSTSSSSGPSGNPSSAPGLASPGQLGLVIAAKSAPTGPTGLTESDKQIVVMCSEKQARVISLPSQTCLYKMKITDTSHVVRASIQRFRPPSSDSSGSVTFLSCYLANGHFMAFSLPSLRMLMDVNSLPFSECVSRSFAFGQYGQVVYLNSPSELLKVTWSADVCANLRDMQGELFLPCNMPEPPKKNFFKTLLSGNLSASLDRDELFGETSSGKGMPGSSTLLPNTKMEKLTGQATGASSEIARARNAAIERGERLGQLDLQTQEMMEQAKGFGRSAAALAAKYEKKDKRWGLPF
ncbi:unnamed protein product [Calicophoron daubneyi]|uniref:V-SNARE coiled-coil homology domain-containing protein n=1 Tax=Calicophoron daubneyi TaxID=300641 RepID=A0AAV2U0V9_CALDB